jgi:hypothetical protein
LTYAGKNWQRAPSPDPWVTLRGVWLDVELESMGSGALYRKDSGGCLEQMAS